MKKKSILFCAIALNALVSDFAVAGIDYSRGGDVATFADLEKKYVIQTFDKTKNVQLVKDPAGSGKQVIMATVRDSDGLSASAKRTEFVPTYEYLIRGVRWYSFAFYLPDSWIFHPYDVVISQLHTSQKTAAVSPPVTFVILGDKLNISLHRTKDVLLETSRANTETIDKRVATLVKNNWYCLIVRADWSEVKDKGELDIWVNGTKVFQERNHLNDFPTWLGNYPKTGIYQPGLMGVAERTAYFDFVRMGDAASSFDEMNQLTPCAKKP